MKSDFSHKIGLYKKYINKYESNDLAKRLGLKKWENAYIREKLISEGFIQRDS